MNQLKKIFQLIQDASQHELSQLRILDLACLEGYYALEFASQGAEVVGIEGREQNITKAKEAQERLGLTNVTFYQDDVRNLSKEKYGEFDVVFASGILYHLYYPDCFYFLEKIHSVCKKFVIIDTHITYKPTVKVQLNGMDYYGLLYREHDPNTSKKERLNSEWASLDNEQSFWFTKASLFNFLTRIGFSSIIESYSMNSSAIEEHNRITLIAYKKKPVQLKTRSNDLDESIFDESIFNRGTLEQELHTYREFFNNLNTIISPTLQKLNEIRKN